MTTHEVLSTRGRAVGIPRQDPALDRERDRSRHAATATIAMAEGDGIGPEIMAATHLVMREAGANIVTRPLPLGLKRFREGHTAGIADEDWQVLDEVRVLLKGPVTTPQGGGMKSLNVTLRKTLGLFANVRPARTYHPFVRATHPAMDVVIIRENEEDVYAGIEHRQSEDVVQCLKLISVPGTERVVRYAFEYAFRHSRKSVACFTKDNIMKLTDGTFRAVFERIASEYPAIRAEHLIVDIGAARIATNPADFDVVVVPNLYGDILSDVTGQLAGSIGMAPSANIGATCAMFEAVHGSAPSIAGRDIANPSGLMISAAMMLAHVGQPRVAERIHNAVLATLEDGIHTADIYSHSTTRRLAGTFEFARAVVARLGQNPRALRAIGYGSGGALSILDNARQVESRRELVGVDVFLCCRSKMPALLAEKLKRLERGALQLGIITNRGVMVWPKRNAATLLTDHWRCRFEAKANDGPLTQRDVIRLLEAISEHGLEVIKTENLYTFDGAPGFTRAHGD